MHEVIRWADVSVPPIIKLIIKFIYILIDAKLSVYFYYFAVMNKILRYWKF